jgi:7,8-dihydro-6-hydroxymethylpterin dimethyltransferase
MGATGCCSANGDHVGTLGRNAAARGDAPFEELSTCLALIEIVRSCNLSCPTCYADSPASKFVDAVPLSELQQRIQGVIDRKGKIEILQLSGGEPTLHPQFFELLEWAQKNPGIDYLLLNTNGVRLANDHDFTQRLGQMFSRGGLQIYLQFDGVQEAGQRWLRGADLRELRERAIARCGEANIPITLAMTVTPENLPNIWDAIQFGLKHSHVHGITFQPMFGSGRVPTLRSSRGHETHFEKEIDQSRLTSAATRNERLNTADILIAAVEQAGGSLRFEDFTPLPCGDPNCATIGYLIRYGGRTYSISDFIDFSRLQGFLKDKIHYTLEDLVKCGCENEPLGALLKQMEVKSSMALRIMVKPFMDAWTWDQDRIDRCCTHVIRPDGKLDSFCRYYSGFADTVNAP